MAHASDHRALLLKNLEVAGCDAEVSRLEKLGDEAGVDTLREWEKEMA